jgi:hypothetical protein
MHGGREMGRPWKKQGDQLLAKLFISLSEAAAAEEEEEEEEEEERTKVERGKKKKKIRYKE